MKDQYAGDVNDYCKYALLRCLSRGSTTTVCWMLTSRDGRSDGRRIGYLDRPAAWRPRDPELFDRLRDLVREGKRTIRAVERARILPRARFHPDLLPSGREGRARYFARLDDLAAGSELLFFDPDNGLEVRSCPRGRRGSERYLYWEELARAYRRGFSIVVYQHFPRVDRRDYVARVGNEIRARVAPARLFSFSSPQVVFFLLARPGRVRVYQRRAAEFARAWEGIVSCGGGRRATAGETAEP